MESLILRTSLKVLTITNMSISNDPGHMTFKPLSHHFHQVIIMCEGKRDVVLVTVTIDEQSFRATFPQLPQALQSQEGTTLTQTIQ